MLAQMDLHEVFRNNCSSMELHFLSRLVPSIETVGSRCTPEWQHFFVRLEMKLDGTVTLKLWGVEDVSYPSPDSLMFRVQEPKPSAKRVTSKSKAMRKKSSKRR